MFLIRTLVFSFLVASISWGGVIIQFTEEPTGVHVNVSGSLNLAPLASNFLGNLNLGGNTFIVPRASAP